VSPVVGAAIRPPPLLLLFSAASVAVANRGYTVRGTEDG
jgi:hypothetical protein